MPPAPETGGIKRDRAPFGCSHPAPLSPSAGRMVQRVCCGSRWAYMATWCMFKQNTKHDPHNTRWITGVSLRFQFPLTPKTTRGFCRCSRSATAGLSRDIAWGLRQTCILRTPRCLCTQKKKKKMQLVVESVRTPLAHSSPPGLHCGQVNVCVSEQVLGVWIQRARVSLNWGQFEECVYSLVRISAQPPRNGALVQAVVAALTFRSRVELLYFILGLWQKHVSSQICGAAALSLFVQSLTFTSLSLRSRRLAPTQILFTRSERRSHLLFYHLGWGADFIGWVFKRLLRCDFVTGWTRHGSDIIVYGSLIMNVCLCTFIVLHYLSLWVSCVPCDYFSHVKKKNSTIL